MNLHPLIVHFPIGLLVAYAVAEMASLMPFFSGRNWVHLRGVLVIAGAVAAFIALQFGEIAQGIVLSSYPEKQSLIETHSEFANITFFVFLVLAISYALHFLEERYGSWFSHGIGNVLRRISGVVRMGPVRIIASLVGLVTITITGGLGASIVYGPNVDPFVHFIYRLFF